MMVPLNVSRSTIAALLLIGASARGDISRWPSLAFTHRPACERMSA